MAKEKLVHSEWVESSQGPPRKYYTLTAKGEEAFRVLDEEFRKLASIVANVGTRAGTCRPGRGPRRHRNRRRLTMANGFSGPVAQIVDNYLERLKKGLKGISAKDQDELVREINSHIYESFRNDPTPDEVARILKVLDKLGEPAAVISARMPEAMVTLGKKRKLPFLILAGVLIAFFGVPLGLSGLGAAVGLIIGVLALVVSFYIVAFSLILAGWLSAVIMIVRDLQPGLSRSLDRHLPARRGPDPEHGHLHRRSAPGRRGGLRDALAGFADDAGRPVRLPVPHRQDQELAEEGAGDRLKSGTRTAAVHVPGRAYFS